MRETYGNIWNFHEQGAWICVTTNGAVRTDGSAVMGRGVAEQAKHRFPKLPQMLGNRLSVSGNVVQVFSVLKIVTFPVKHHWKDKADFNLIKLSAVQLMQKLSDTRWGIQEIYLPRPGCGNGQRDWEQVRDVIYEILDDRVIAITLEANQQFDRLKLVL